MMDENPKKPNWPLGIVGAVAGGVAGYFVFLWAAQQGFYAIIVPGAAVGLGCAALAKGESRGLGILCAVLALAAGLLSEWRQAPFVDDDNVDKGLAYFVTHVNHLQSLTLILIALGAAFAYWLGKGQPRCGGGQGRENDADGRPGSQ